MRTLFLGLVACSESAPGFPDVTTAPATVAPGSHDPGDTSTRPATTAAMGTAPAPPASFPTVAGSPLALCVNEFMPSTRISVLDETGTPSDWIELHNPTEADVSLAGWSVSDDPVEPRKHWLDQDLVIEAGGFLVLWADDLPDVGPTHLGFGLSGAGEAVALYSPEGDGSVVWYGPVGDDLAVGRVTDCCEDEGDGACFVYSFRGSPGETNAPTE